MSIPTYYTPVAGTDGWDEDPNRFAWWEDGSPFTLYLRSLNLYVHSDGPFEWCTDISGDLFRKDLRIWKAAAKHFACYVKSRPFHERNFICHSHGGQLPLIASTYGVEINNLITVGTPYRHDIKPTQANIRYWLHICDRDWDTLGTLGALFDGVFGLSRLHPEATVNYPCKGIGHSGILKDPTLFHLWEDNGWARAVAYGSNPPNS